ncbi:hypothetical protein [Mesorhizobium sp.]|uniref:hypothetical protein n=1 Tax=Mesorhizobium sp. TaxID=1871066 RepID=UPI000FE691C9|nr:hypothetical protein [Mesorhizobium sp.]RWN35814.1 MAG: hypothetical protein EOR95_12510 [Mesorhizobium sp.]
MSNIKLWQQMKSAPVLIRALASSGVIPSATSAGVQLVRTGEPVPAETPTGPTIVANQVYAQPETVREVRAEAGKFSIVAIKAGETTVEQTFTLNEIMLNAGLVLGDDPIAKTIKGLGRQLAAATEIYRLNAAGMGGGK